MKTTKLFNRLIQFGLTFLSVALLTQDLTYAQRLDRPTSTGSLISKKNCQITGDHGVFTDYGSGLVSVGKQAFSSIFRFSVVSGNTAVLSCLIPKNSPSYKTLTLKFGIQDGENGYINNSYQVAIYLDGQMQGRTSIVRGNLRTVVLDISKTRSIGIEVNCSDISSATPNIHFVGDTLTP